MHAHIPTHTPCLAIANMAVIEAVRKCISTQKPLPLPFKTIIVRAENGKWDRHLWEWG